MKKVLFIVIFIFLVSFSTVSAKEKKKYLAIGDSITYGHSLDNPVEMCYPTLFANKHNFELTNEAVSGDESKDYMSKRVNYDYNSYDVISICIGANDIFHVLTRDEHIVNYTDIFELYDYINGLSSNKEFNDKIDQQLEKFEENFKIIMDELNSSNAEIYVLNVYNPFKLVGIANLSSATKSFVTRLNTIINNNKGKAKLVDVYSVFEEKNQSTNKLVFAGLLKIDPHPTEKGQKEICNTLDNSYNEEHKNPYMIIIILGSCALPLLAIELFIVNKVVFKNRKAKRNIEINKKEENNVEIPTKKEEKSSRFSRN